MTQVIYGACPDCGKSDMAGATCYSDTGQRVVPCSCGSRRPPAPRASGLNVSMVPQHRMVFLSPGDVVLNREQVRQLEARGWKL